MYTIGIKDGQKTLRRAYTISWCTLSNEYQEYSVQLVASNINKINSRYSDILLPRIFPMSNCICINQTKADLILLVGSYGFPFMLFPF
jgi:hypothetical protein